MQFLTELLFLFAYFSVPQFHPLHFLLSHFFISCHVSCISLLLPFSSVSSTSLTLSLYPPSIVSMVPSSFTHSISYLTLYIQFPASHFLPPLSPLPALSSCSPLSSPPSPIANLIPSSPDGKCFLYLSLPSPPLLVAPASRGKALG